MTGYESKKAAARDKLDDDDALTIAYQSGFYDGKKAAQPAQKPVAWMYQYTADNSEPVLLRKKQNWAESGTGLWVETPLFTTPPQPAQEREALKLALEVLENLPGFRADIDNAITAIKEVLEKTHEN